LIGESQLRKSRRRIFFISSFSVPWFITICMVPPPKISVGPSPIPPSPPFVPPCPPWPPVPPG
jgi:hypothetical protein